MGPKKGSLQKNRLGIFPCNLPTDSVFICVAFFSFGFYGYGAHPLNLIFSVFLLPLLTKQNRKRERNWHFKFIYI
jgi:hypothetical protein